jgi:hypothetical protein
LYVWLLYKERSEQGQDDKDQEAKKDQDDKDQEKKSKRVAYMREKRLRVKRG